MTRCWIGWIDSFGYLDGRVPKTQLGLSRYYKQQAAEKYAELRDAGLAVEVNFEYFNKDEAPFEVDVSWRTNSLAAFTNNVAAAICTIPDGNAYGVNVGNQQFTEDDFEMAGQLLPATLRRIIRLFPGDDDGITSDLFWDCECKHNYIHAYAMGNHCPFCGAFEHSQPDSHKSELHQYEADRDCAEQVEVAEA